MHLIPKWPPTLLTWQLTLIIYFLNAQNFKFWFWFFQRNKFVKENVEYSQIYYLSKLRIKFELIIQKNVLNLARYCGIVLLIHLPIRPMFWHERLPRLNPTSIQLELGMHSQQFGCNGLPMDVVLMATCSF